jgi:prepilin-type N-terminal cleavage/methylation domain-containing protein
MKILQKNNGFTMIEMLTALTITTFIAVVMLNMMTSSLRCFNICSYETLTDSDAVAAMQTIVRDVREAKSVAMVNGNILQITLPVASSSTFNGSTISYYDRHTPSATGQISYYLSDSTGAQNKTGNWLWRSISGGSQHVLCRTVSSTGLVFAQDTPRSIEITITMLPCTEWKRNAKGPDQTTLTQRVVYLRNY